MVAESQKQVRRQRLLDAAESLIRTSGSTNFSMLTLAKLARVSPATPYNLLGSKVGVLYALLNSSLDKIVQRLVLANDHGDPFDRVVQAAVNGAEFFASEPDFYRPLFQFLLGCDDPVHRPIFLDRSLSYWFHATSSLEERGYLKVPIDQSELSREMVIHFIGVLDLWVQHELTDDAFRAQIVFGTSLLLMSVADDQARVRLMKHLEVAKRKLPSNFSFSTVAARSAQQRLEAGEVPAVRKRKTPVAPDSRRV